MSTFVREVVLVRRGFADRVELARRMVARATAGPLLVRGTVAVSALAALLLAYPVETVRGAPVGLLLVVAVLPALRPRGRLVTTVVIAAVLGWLLRAGLVVALTAGFAFAVLLGVLPVSGSRSFLVASIAGLAVMAALALLLAYLRRR